RDPRQSISAHLHRGPRAGTHQVADVTDGSHNGDGVVGLSRHPITRGTLKKPASSAPSGAFASASSRSSEGRTSSGRSAASRATTLAVGGTPVVLFCRA